MLPIYERLAYFTIILGIIVTSTHYTAFALTSLYFPESAIKLLLIDSYALHTLKQWIGLFYWGAYRLLGRSQSRPASSEFCDDEGDRTWMVQITPWSRNSQKKSYALYRFDKQFFAFQNKMTP